MPGARTSARAPRAYCLRADQLLAAQRTVGRGRRCGACRGPASPAAAHLALRGKGAAPAPNTDCRARQGAGSSTVKAHRTAARGPAPDDGHAGTARGTALAVSWRSRRAAGSRQPGGAREHLPCAGARRALGGISGSRARAVRPTRRGTFARGDGKAKARSRGPCGRATPGAERRRHRGGGAGRFLSPKNTRWRRGRPAATLSRRSSRAGPVLKPGASARLPGATHFRSQPEPKGRRSRACGPRMAYL